MDTDVLKLVKEYLRVHLNRRLLNKQVGVGAHGLKRTFYQVNHCYRYFIMGEEFSIKSCENLYLYNHGSNDITRRNLILFHKSMFNKLREDQREGYIKKICNNTLKIYVRHLMNTEEHILRELSDNTLKMYIRQLMDIEERIILKYK